MPARAPERLEGFNQEQSEVVRKVFSQEDAVKFAEWSKDSGLAADMVESLNLFSQGREKGTPRLLVLVDACANFYYRQRFEVDETLTTTQRKEFAGQVLHALAEDQVRVADGDVNEEKVTDAMRQIFMEGFDDEEKLTSPGEVTTVLSGKIEELVGPWVKKDSPAAKIEKLQKDLEILSAQQQRIQDGAGASEDEAERLKELAEAQTTHIQDLQRKLRVVEAGGGNWNDERRKAVGELFSAQPEKVRNQIESALKKLDPINDKKVASQIEAPENLAETDKTLLEKLGKLEGLDSGKLVAAGISNEVMGSLAQILRLQLEQRRAGQETTRRNNREKKAVRDYFAEHEIRLTISNSGIANELNVNVQKAATLGIKPFAEDFCLMLTGNELKLNSVQAVGIFLDTSGGITSTAVTVEDYKEFEKNVVWDELFYLCKKQEKGREFALEKQYAQGGAGEDSYVIMAGEQTIGRVKYNPDQRGKLTINWEKVGVETIFRASTYLVNLIEKVEGEGSEIKGLWVDGVRSEKIKAEKEAAEKPAEKKPKEEVKEVVPAVEETQPPMAKTETEQVKEGLGF